MRAFFFFSSGSYVYLHFPLIFGPMPYLGALNSFGDLLLLFSSSRRHTAVANLGACLVPEQWGGTCFDLLYMCTSDATEDFNRLTAGLRDGANVFVKKKCNL